MTFSQQPLGIAWLAGLNRAIEFVDLSINRWRELQAEQFYLGFVPPELEQFLQTSRQSMPDWVVTYDDLARFFVVPEDATATQVGFIVLDELRFIRTTMEQLPQVYFEPPTTEQPEPEPDPNTSECERLIAAIENLKPGPTAAEIRQIVVESLQPVVTEILNQGHNTRVELKEARRDAKLAVSALYPYSDQEAEVRRSVFQGFFAIWNFPKTFPKSLVTKFNSSGDPLPPETKQINNLMDFFEWVVVVFEEILGEFPSSIEFVANKEEKIIMDQDGNPVLDADGNPKTEIEVFKATTRFPNMAEILSEIVPLVYQSYTNTEKLLELTSKNLIESGSTKATAIKNFYRLKAIEKSMGLTCEAKTKKIPLAFTVGQKNLLGFSKPSTTDIEIVEWNEELDQREIFHELLFAAKVIRARFFQSLPNSQEGAAARIKEIITNNLEHDEKLTAKSIDNEQIAYNKIERAFIDTPGIGDTTDFWGGDIENTVRIRRITNEPVNEPENPE